MVVCRLRELLDERGISALAFAKMSYVTGQTVYHWLDGVIPSLENALFAARALGCRVEDIWTIEEVKT